jgi:ABC-2 type transport system ATP-binding protein
MIDVTGLTKVYGVNNAVSDLTFNAKKGEILGFLGPNGAGKTTTMRILTGYIPPTSGTVTIGGFDVIEQSMEVRKLVGYLPESVPLYTDMRVNEYLQFMGSLHKVKNVKDRVSTVLEQVGMTERAGSFISKLSKGMRQRVGLAQALIHEPEVLILDEPTVGLDPAQIIEVRKLIQEIGKEKTVLLSTHILSEAQQICNRVLIINRGKLVAEDSPENLQKNLFNSQKVFVKVSGDAKAALEIIKAIPEVNSSYLDDQGQIVFENLPENDMRPKVTKLLISSGFDLLDMHTDSVNLEEIFLQLTAKDEHTGFSQSSSNDAGDVKSSKISKEK